METTGTTKPCTFWTIRLILFKNKIKFPHTSTLRSPKKINRMSLLTIKLTYAIITFSDHYLLKIKYINKLKCFQKFHHYVSSTFLK